MGRTLHSQPNLPGRDSFGRRHAGALALLYLVCGLLWVLGTDSLVAWLAPPDSLPVIGEIKGTAYVLVTTMLFYVVMRRHSAQMSGQIAAERAALSQHYAHIVDRANDIVLLIDDRYRIVDANQRAVEAYGYSQADLVGKDVRQLRTASARAAFEADMHRHVEYGSVYETEHQHRDGSSFPVEISARLLEIEGRQFFQAIIRDISERKQTDVERDRHAREYESLADNVPDVILRADQDGKILFANRALTTVLGIAPEEALGKPGRDLGLPSDCLEDWEHNVREVFTTGRTISFDCHVKLPDGVRHIDVRVVPEISEAGTVKTTLSIGRDVTGQNAMLDKLQSSERRYRQLVELMPDALAQMDAQQSIVSANRSALRMFGVDSIEHAVGQSIFRFVAPAHADAVREKLAQLARTGILHGSEHDLLRSDGTPFVGEISAAVIQGELDEGPIATLIIRDVTARKHAEEVLFNSREKLRALLDGLPDPAWMKDDAGHYTAVNQAFSVEAGKPIEQIIGRKAEEIWSDEARAPFLGAEAAAIDAKSVRQMEAELITPRGREWFAVTEVPIFDRLGKLSGITGIARNVTEHRKIDQERREHMQQMQDALIQTIQAMALTVEKRDPYTAGHQSRVAELAVAIGREMGLPEAQLRGIQLGATIHDIGKIYIPAEILNRPGHLTEPELQLIRTHVSVGYDIVKDIHFIWPVKEMVLQHHERLDGSGYPSGLQGDEIAFEARILAVADVVEAMSSHRPYRPSLGTQRGLDEIREGSGKRYDSLVVAACLRLFEEARFTFEFEAAA